MAARWHARVVASVVAIAAGSVMVASSYAPSTTAVIPLYSQAVGLGGGGLPELVDPGSLATWLPGTRVLLPDTSSAAAMIGAQRRAASTRNWLAAGSIPGSGTAYEHMSRNALLDLHVLTASTHATVAAWSTKWRYVWPRDASFAAVALAGTGHLDDAVKNLQFLQDVQGEDGSLHARYLSDGSGPPDARGLQEDGPGWALWAVGQVAERIPDDADRLDFLETFSGLVDRSTDRIIRLAHERNGLPAPSSDYWEVPEWTVTLGVVAPMLAGLHSAQRIYVMSGQADRAHLAGLSAQRLRDNAEATFGVEGYPRHLGANDPDASIPFVLPPFQTAPLSRAVESLQAAIPRMMRPAGGIAPGSGWKRDGISWTPETALLALEAAHRGDVPEAQRWLTWLDEHRTPSGSLPEKVLSDGSPAAVAPLAWTAATVLLALDQLDALASSP